MECTRLGLECERRDLSLSPRLLLIQLLQAEYIESMDIISASGELVTASQTQNSDLFWAARGAGFGFFGVVVRFRLQ